MAGMNQQVNDGDLMGAGGVPAPPEEVAEPPAGPDEEDLLDQQPGPAQQRPSLAIPGKRVGSTIYADGNGYYYHSERVRGNRRYLRCLYQSQNSCLARALMGLEEGAPIILRRDILVPPYSIVDGLDAVNNYVEEGHLDVRLHAFIAYVRRYWLGLVGVESMSTFGAARRTNNDLESFHSKLLAAFGVNLDIWSFIRRLQVIEQEAHTNVERLDRGEPLPIRRARSRTERDNTNRIRAALARLTREQITVINFLSVVGHCADYLVNLNMAQPQPLEEAIDEEDYPVDWMLLPPVAAEAEEDVVAAQQRPRPRPRPRPAARRARRPVVAEQRPVPAENDQQPIVMNQCVICLANESTHIAIPCGHVCMCGTCAEQNETARRRMREEQVEENRWDEPPIRLCCPLCNTPSTEYLRAWFNR